jgi:RNA recognition motif-containing protein
VPVFKLITDKITGQARGFGFVEMPIQIGAEAAIKALNGTAIEGRTIEVSIARDRRR